MSYRLYLCTGYNTLVLQVIGEEERARVVQRIEEGAAEEQAEEEAPGAWRMGPFLFNNLFVVTFDRDSSLLWG